MKAYLRAFVNWKQNDQAKRLPMAEFVYNNVNNTITGHISFKLNFGHHPRVSFGNETDPHSKSRSTNEPANELRNLKSICQQNLMHAQELQKHTPDKGMKPYSYAPGKKVWLTSKYIRTKQNQKLKAKFFRPFQVFYPMSKQIYKLELPARQKIDNVFHVLLLQQDITRKRQVNKLLEFESELDVGEDKKYTKWKQ